MKVHDYCFAGYRSQIERPIIEEDYYIILIGGLDLIHIEKTMLSLQLFTKWISGNLGEFDDVKVRNIARLIVVGNCIRNEKEATKPSLSLTSRTPVSSDSIDAVKTLDALLYTWCAAIDVDIMPGENDPTNHILPQQPMHRCMFPNAGLYKSLHLVSNPYEFDINGLKLLGTSGQPVTDVMRYCDTTDPLEVLENCLKWNHIAPTAPDTLGCYPFHENDPFILESCPHVLFAGNQNDFSTKVCTGMLFDCVLNENFAYAICFFL